MPEKKYRRLPRTVDDLLAFRKKYRPATEGNFAPVQPSAVRHAVLRLLEDAPRSNTFTNVMNPVWHGWTSAHALLWLLSAEMSDAPLVRGGGQTCAAALGELLLNMVDAGLLEKRLCHPYQHNPNPDIASQQDWEFRLPGDVGYCYWEPGHPAEAQLAQHWEDCINQRHLQQLLTNLGGDTVPPFILARIERRWLLQRKRRRILIY